MDRDELGIAMTQVGLKIFDALKVLDKVKVAPAKKNFEPPENLKADSAKNSREKLDAQRSGHRTALLWLVAGLSLASFLLLALVVLIQMWVRTNDPDYTGVSDVVVNILAGGVFAEVIAVVAVIAKEVWKDPAS